MRKKFLFSCFICLLFTACVLIFTGCDKDNTYTKGLEYSISSDSCTVMGIGKATDETDIVIPAEYKGKPVTRIREFAFASNNKIKSIVIPDSVTFIGKRVFSGSLAIENITSPFFSQTPGSSESGLLHFFGNIRYVPKNLNKITVTKYLGDNNLSGMNATEIIIGEDVKEIGKSALSGCKRIKNIILPDGVTKIGNEAFSYCSSLESITIPGSVETISFKTFNYCKSLKNVILKNGVKNIGQQSFEDCGGIREMTMPASIKSIKYHAFWNSYVDNLRFEGTFNDWCDMNFTESYSYPLNYQSTLYINDAPMSGDITIPIGTTKIGKQSFQNLQKITGVTIPDSVTSIQEKAFYSCKNIKNIVFGKNLTSIDIEAFRYCTSLESVVIPDGVTNIGRAAFADCENITEFVLPTSILKIDNHSIYCISLKQVTYKGKKAEWEKIEKGEYWTSKNYSGVEKVVCTDGEIIVDI